MGRSEGFAYGSAAEIWDEVRRVWPRGAGISYQRIEGRGLQWPCPSEAHPGTQLLHTTAFATAKTAQLHAASYSASPEQPDLDYPFALITGRKLYQFNAGTMTARTANLSLQPADVVEMSPGDAARFAIASGELVRICSRYGEATLPVTITDAVNDGELFATFHTAAVFLNRVTGPYLDPFTHTPEYKLTAVRLEKVCR
jgi:formate dehydrogenase major subunit